MGLPRRGTHDRRQSDRKQAQEVWKRPHVGLDVVVGQGGQPGSPWEIEEGKGQLGPVGRFDQKEKE